jgi:hypothetical protein
MAKENDIATAGDAYLDYTKQAREKLIELKARKDNKADTVMKDYEEWSSKAQGTIVEARGLTGSQQSIFMDKTNPVASHNTDAMAAHQAKEAMNYKVKVADSTLQNARATAALTPADETAIGEAIGAYEEHAVLANKSAGEILRGKSSVMVGGALNLAEDDPEAARRIYLDNEKNRKMLGAAVGQVEAKINTRENDDEALARAKGIWDENFGDYKAMKDRARNIKDSETQAKVSQWLNAWQSDETAAKNLQTKAIREGAIDSAIKMKDAGVPYADALAAAQKATGGVNRENIIPRLNAIYGVDPTKESTRDIYAYKMEARRRIDLDKGEGNDLATEAEIYDEYVLKVGAAGVKEIVDYWKKGGNVGGISDASVRGFYEQAMGRKVEKNVALYNAVWEDVIRALPPGVEATPKVIKELVNDALMKGEIVKGGIFDEDLRKAEARAGGEYPYWVADLSDDQKTTAQAAIAEYNKKHGSSIPINDETLGSHYKDGIDAWVDTYSAEEKEQYTKAILEYNRTHSGADIPINSRTLGLYRRHEVLGFPKPTRRGR